MPRRVATILAALAASLGAPVAGGACVRLGVYEDAPATTLPGLRAAVGGHVTSLALYLAPGERVPASTIALVRRLHLQLVVAWEPGDGHEPPRTGTLARVAAGRYDAALRALARQLVPLRPVPILRPLPEPNTTFHAWGHGVGTNTPARYRAAWHHLRAVLRTVRGGSRIRLLWSPYVRSLPDVRGNAIGDWLPRRAEVDLVGTVGYNFGATYDLDWALPQTLFQDSYDTIEGLLARPFWIAETGSTDRGGDKAAWIDQLATLPETMPRLAGISWYDVGGTDDFRIRQTAATQRSFRALARWACG